MLSEQRGAPEEPPEVADNDLPQYLRRGDTPAEAAEKLMERREREAERRSRVEQKLREQGHLLNPSRPNGGHVH